VWAADLDPGIPTFEALGPAQTVEEYFREQIEACNRDVAVAPNWFDRHRERAVSALWIDDPLTSRYLQELALAADRTPDWPTVSYSYVRGFLMRPAFQERLLPLMVLLARKIAEKEAGYARGLAPVLYEMGQQKEALHLWRTGEAAAPGGYCRYDARSDSYAVKGYGIDIWETCDDFHFVFKQLGGDGSISARIDTIADVDTWTKAGVMIRSSLAPDSSNAMVLVTPSGRLAFQYRITGRYGNATNSVPMPANSVQLPCWVRLIRRGDRFAAQHSRDGITGQDMLYGPDQPVTMEIPMAQTVYLGLAVTSHDVGRAAEAQFSRVSTAGEVSPPGPFTESQDIHFQPPSSPDAAADPQIH
jgi:hypothetical protein